MNFDRGKNIKESIGIGLREKIKEDVHQAIGEHGWNICNVQTRKLLEKKISAKYGANIGLSIEDFRDRPTILAITSYSLFEDSIRIDIREIYVQWNLNRMRTNDTGPR